MRCRSYGLFCGVSREIRQREDRSIFRLPTFSLDRRCFLFLLVALLLLLLPLDHSATEPLHALLNCTPELLPGDPHFRLHSIQTMATISAFKVEDLRFPTSLDGDGTDASESAAAHAVVG